MLRTLLFDLDGTLLPLDQDQFTRGYFKQLAPKMVSYMAPDRFLHHVMASTEAMVQNAELTVTNEQAFKNDFLQATGLREEDVWPIFMDFYEGPFGDLKNLTQPSPLAREICHTAIEKGYELVLATNPVFPGAAIEHRMRWAGIYDVPWALVTTLEEMHFCKPQIGYYQEILQKLGRSAEECIMIGNNPFEDMIAATIGISTYLVSDHPANDQGNADWIGQKGSLEDLKHWVNSLPEV